MAEIPMIETELHIALFQPDIAGNTGAIMRLAACLGMTVDLIEPAGFDMSDRNLKRAGMDYLELASLVRHRSWEAFEEWRAAEGRRLVLFTTSGAAPYTQFQFRARDILLFGRESAGVPEHVHAIADERVIIPMRAEARSLNLAMAAAMGSGEALRQVAGAR